MFRNTRLEQEIKLFLEDQDKNSENIILVSSLDDIISSKQAIFKIKGPEKFYFKDKIFKIKIEFPENYPFDQPRI